MRFSTQCLIAIVAGLLLRPVITVGQPLAWLAWIAPVPLLSLAIRISDWKGRACLCGACLIATAVNANFMLAAMPWPTATVMMLLQALLWSFVVTQSARILRRTGPYLGVFAYPVLWAALDTLMARFLPDGNWGSLAYSQAEFLPLMQTASVAGTAGIVFLLGLPASALAMALTNKHARRPALALALLPPLAATAWGSFRLTNAQPPARFAVGIVAIDDPIGLQAKMPYIDGIRDSYRTRVAELAASRPRVILLPEKIAVVREASAPEWDSYFSSLAASNRVWLIAGLAIQRADGISNEAWTYNPAGQRANVYQKRILAPPERRDYVPGNTAAVFDLEGISSGVAICKDMHFARVGRDYAHRAAVVYVPAWDFGFDAWLEARTTATRGIEGGYSIIRSSREGLLSISDAFGQMVSESPSKAQPGATLFVPSAPYGQPIATLYGTIGDTFGWICVAGAIGLAIYARRRD